MPNELSALLFPYHFVGLQPPIEYGSDSDDDDDELTEEEEALRMEFMAEQARHKKVVLAAIQEQREQKSKN